MQPDSTKPNYAALWQAGLITVTGLMLLVKVFSGALSLYVHTRYTPLIAGTGVVLVLLGCVQAWLTFSGESHAHDHAHSHAPLSWRSPAMLALLVPIVLGLVVPPRALGSAAIDTRGFGNTGTGIRTVETIANSEDPAARLYDTAQWTLLDWVNALIYQPDNPSLQGQPIEVVGFVWRNDELAEDQFYVARFIVSCCTADSLAIYLPVVWPAAAEMKPDTWVRVTGTVGLTEMNGEKVAIINATEITPVSQPNPPYLYP